MPDTVGDLTYRQRLAADTLMPSLVPGQWYFFREAVNTYNEGNFGEGVMAISPVFIDKQITVSALACMVQAAGSAGSAIRMFIYKDNNGYPGDLLAETGAIATTAVAVVSAALLGGSKVLTPGIYWVGIVQQGAPATRAQLSACVSPIPIPLKLGSVPVNVGYTVSGYFFGGVNGALPSTYPAANYGLAGSVPKLQFQAG